MKYEHGHTTDELDHPDSHSTETTQQSQVIQTIGLVAEVLPTVRATVTGQQISMTSPRQKTDRDDPPPDRKPDSDGRRSAPESSDDGDRPEEDMEETTERLPLDNIFEILKNSRRRETLRYLKANGGETTLGSVAEHIAAIENDTTVRAIFSTQRKRVYVGLYQCHLPKMDDFGVVSFDKNRGTIELGPAANQLDPYLEATESDRDWHRVYLGLTAVGGLLFALAQVGGGNYGLTTTLILTGLILGLGTIAVVHTLVESGYELPEALS